MRALLALLMMLGGCAPETPTVIGRATVIDGDTLEVQGSRIRLWGVDAPEAAQRCGEAQGGGWRCGAEAANQLDGLIGGRPVSCYEEDLDRYGRMVARCEVGGEDLGAWLIRRGLAIRYTRYAGRAYEVEERAAREERMGLWAGEFVAPDEWRRRRRAGE